MTCTVQIQWPNGSQLEVKGNNINLKGIAVIILKHLIIYWYVPRGIWPLPFISICPNVPDRPVSLKAVQWRCQSDRVKSDWSLIPSPGLSHRAWNQVSPMTHISILCFVTLNVIRKLLNRPRGLKEGRLVKPRVELIRLMVCYFKTSIICWPWQWLVRCFPSSPAAM